MTVKANESLFVASGDLSDVVLNWYGDSVDKLDTYAESYRSAAQALVERLSGLLDFHADSETELTERISRCED